MLNVVFLLQWDQRVLFSCLGLGVGNGEAFWMRCQRVWIEFDLIGIGFCI